MEALEILILGIIMGLCEGIAIGKMIGENMRRDDNGTSGNTTN